MRSTTHAQLDSQLGADSVALVGAAQRTQLEPDRHSIQQTAVVGTYELAADEHLAAQPKRRGALVFLRASRIYSHTDTQLTLDHISTVHDLPGVLDVACCDVFHPPAARRLPTLYAACAENTLQSVLVESVADAKTASTTNLMQADQSQQDNIILSVDVVRETEHSVLTATSDSHGAVSVFRTANGNTSPVESRKAVHAQEAWTTCLDVDPQNAGGPVTVYSGGDDGTLCGWQMGSNHTTIKLRKAHQGVGVTAIAKNRYDTSHFGQMSLWTGGYDDTLRVWDIRAMRRCVSEVCVGGGVWRIKFHPHDAGLVLVASMYDGFKVVQVDSSSLETSVTARYDGHKSLAYGASWVPALDCGNERVALTGSFYDHCVQLWSVLVAGG